MTIGRSSKADIKIDDGLISREHVKFKFLSKDKILIEDLASKNGTYINQVKIKKHTLLNGDRIKIGSTIFKFGTFDQIEKQFQNNLFMSSIRDALTNIYNRKYFLESLKKEFSYAKRHKEPVGLIMFDIDKFKAVNDTYGHIAGDSILKEVVITVNSAIREEDVFARTGGEEFALILKKSNLKETTQLAGRLRALFDGKYFTIDKTDISITITISSGCDIYDGTKYETMEDFIEAVDKLMLAAKKAGRNRVITPKDL
jgi:diguanylate cyclase (GGDEF)-like protein